MTKLSVNLNAVAYLRNRRALPWPSVARLGRIALEAGADGLTVHPRPDERHTRRSDVFELRALLAEFPDREYNIEGYPDEPLLALCEEARPHQVTLVPDAPAQATSDHGWDIAAHAGRLETIVGRLRRGGMRVSLFIDADPAQPPLAAAIGADRVELFTGPYGGALDPERRTAALARLTATAAAARGLVALNAGHDLTRANLPPLKASIPELAEVSIGHALIADALEFGMAETVRLFKKACA
jgi:pyridoxine 5-phosphate synthase